jgi:hypothetical protein
MLFEVISDDIITFLLSEWLEKPTDLASLDIAICNTRIRAAYLQSLKKCRSNSIPFTLTCKLNRNVFHEWVQKRELNISSVIVECFNRKKLDQYEFWLRCQFLKHLVVQYGNKWFATKNAPRKLYLESLLSSYPSLESLKFTEADYTRNVSKDDFPDELSLPAAINHPLKKLEIEDLYFRPLEIYHFLKILLHRCPQIKVMRLESCTGIHKEILLFLLQHCTYLEELTADIEILGAESVQGDRASDADDDDEAEFGSEDEENEDDDAYQNPDYHYEDEEESDYYESDYSYGDGYDDDNEEDDDDDGYETLEDEEDEGNERNSNSPNNARANRDGNENENEASDHDSFETIDENESEEGRRHSEEEYEDDEEEEEEEEPDEDDNEDEGELFLRQIRTIRDMVNPSVEDPFARQGSVQYVASRLHTVDIRLDNSDASYLFSYALDLFQAFPITLRHLAIHSEDSSPLSKEEERLCCELVGSHWKCLESLELDCEWGTDAVAESISLHCSRLTELTLLFSTYSPRRKHSIFTDVGLHAISKHCITLKSLEIQDARKITDVGIFYLCEENKARCAQDPTYRGLEVIHLENCIGLTQVGYENLIVSLPFLRTIDWNIPIHAVSFIKLLQGIANAHSTAPSTTENTETAKCKEENKLQKRYHALESLTYTGPTFGKLVENNRRRAAFLVDEPPGEMMSTMEDIVTLFLNQPSNLLWQSFAHLRNLSLHLSEITINVMMLQVLCTHLPMINTLLLSIQLNKEVVRLDELSLERSHMPSLHSLALLIAKAKITLPKVKHWLEEFPYLSFLQLPGDELSGDDMKSLEKQYHLRSLHCELS